MMHAGPPVALDFREWREMLRARLQHTPGLANAATQDLIRQAIALLLPEGSAAKEAAMAMDAWDGVLAFLAAKSNQASLTVDEWLTELKQITGPAAN